MAEAGDPIIDVRTRAEYERRHIAGALNIPIDTLPGALAMLEVDGPVLTACTYGNRGGRAAELIALSGRTAFSIEGGTHAWQQAGLPVVNGPAPGRRLHPRP
ncbi:MAG: rhodanese-like domain-containing protein [Actinobacteria bacterium]|nr:rhodanese-like domain-containing protein [Actinomycetota bacterium]